MSRIGVAQSQAPILRPCGSKAHGRGPPRMDVARTMVWSVNRTLFAGRPMLVSALPRVPRPLVLAILALAGQGAPLVALAVGGVFSRYAADDYCTAGQVQMAGFVEVQSRLYVGWSGRFAATLVVTLVEQIGP